MSRASRHARSPSFQARIPPAPHGAPGTGHSPAGAGHSSKGLVDRETFIPAPRAEVFAFFGDPNNLARITPPSLGFEIIDAPRRTLRQGDRIRYRIRLLGIPLPWLSHITEWDEGRFFVDEQERGPYRRWRHEHTLRDAPGGVLMLDRVEFELPLGLLGRIFGGWFVRRNLRQIFDYRAQAIGRIFPGAAGV